MKKKLLVFALTAALILCSCARSSAQASSASTAPAATAAAVSDTALPGGITPEQFGARGDGIGDDQQALQSAIEKASASGLPLELKAGAVYRFTSFLDLPSGLTIRGNGAVLLSDIQYTELQEDRVAVGIIGRSDEEYVHDVRLENVVFRAASNCQSNYMLRMMRTRNAVLTGCTFDCTRNDWKRGAADLYGCNENIRFENCVFRQLTAGEAGGIWVRNWKDQAESRNIRFENCDFYKAGADEVVAVWGWNGAVEDVVFSGCGFYEASEPEYKDVPYYPVWLITLGQSGRTDVRMENCTIDFDRCETLFRMVGEETHAVVDNCDITMEQPKSMAKHSMAQGANPMLARGNGRSDGSTLIQNSRITLKGDSGRRVCYELSALRNDTLDINLGYGIASTKEVSGNTIRGRIRHKVFQDCFGVENNNVEVRRFLIFG